MVPEPLRVSTRKSVSREFDVFVVYGCFADGHVWDSSQVGACASEPSIHNLGANFYDLVTNETVKSAEYFNSKECKNWSIQLRFYDLYKTTGILKPFDSNPKTFKYLITSKFFFLNVFLVKSLITVLNFLFQFLNCQLLKSPSLFSLQC